MNESTARRLDAQLAFILEADKLKEIHRRTYLLSGARTENSAEHSWHLALMAMVLSEYANSAIDTFKVLRMLLVHDLVEVDAGDTFCYDDAGNLTKSEREKAAADRLFGLLPEEQGREFRRLWEEFESAETAEARFAAALDRVSPVLLNLRNQGRGWKEHSVSAEQVFARNSPIANGSEVLWERVKAELDRAVAEGVIS
jgi:putative hydrolase of HD superfamily